MTTRPNLTESENAFLSHNVRWGSDMYPVRKLRAGVWIWDDFAGVKGAPTVYKTKRAAVAAIEAYLEILVAKTAGRL